MRNWKPFIVSVIVAPATVFILLRGNISQLRTENQLLRDQVATLTDELQASRDVGGKNPEDDTASRERMNELMRLRAEVTELRKVRDQPVAQKTVSKSDEAFPTQDDSPPLPQSTIKPPFDFAGYSTARDALSSYIWAMQNGRSDLMLNAATPEAEAQLRQGLLSNPNNLQRVQTEASKVLGVRLNDEQENEAFMTIIIGNPAIGTPPPEGFEERGAKILERVVKFQKIGTEWKWGGAVIENLGFSYE